MKENPIRSLPGIPVLLGLLAVALFGAWLIVTGAGGVRIGGIALVAGAAFLLCVDSSSLLLGAYCGKDAIADGLSAGDMIREVAALAGGKGGGRADQARGSAPQDADPQALAAAARNIING